MSTPAKKRLDRKRLARIALAMALLIPGVVAANAQTGAPARKPNLIFILADDLGWGDLGCYGNTRIKTPHLDRLAKQGTLFTQFYVNGSVCSPSRCAFMTGQYPARHKIHGHYATPELNSKRGMSQWLDPKVPNVAALLKSAGYRTAHYGKWHLGHGSNAPPLSAYGFDDARAYGGNPQGWDEPPETFFAKSTRVFVDETLRFIRTNREQTFYVQLWTLMPHAPLNPTDEQMAPYNWLSWRNGEYHKSAATIYYSLVADLDAQVGRLLGELDELGLATNTLVMFSSDNGPEDIHLAEAGHSGIGSAGPFRGRKRSLYEGGIRVPGIVRWPGKVPAGVVDQTSVLAGVDWLPTVCRFVGIPIPAAHKLDGEDVSDILLGKPRPRTTPLLWEWRFHIFGEPFHRSPILAIREGDWSLLLNPDRSRVELYDLPRDPTQLNNLAEKHPDTVAALAGKALDWQATLPKGPLDPTAGKADYPWPGVAKPVK